MASKKFDGDGHTRAATAADMVPGQVIRTPNDDGSSPPFLDTVVLRESEHGWKVARPYLFEHLGGWMSGVEEYEVMPQNLVRVKVVLTARGEPYRMTITREIPS